MGFLYQKVRAYVPSELQDSLKDPLSKLVPLPFYVLPYKAHHAMQRGLTAIESPRQSQKPSTRKGSIAAPPPMSSDMREDWFREKISDLEEMLPLASSSSVAVPHFLAHLMQCRDLTLRAGMDEELFLKEAPLRDRFDVLIADAVTVYMSAWRITGVPGEASQATQQICGAATSTSRVSQAQDAFLRHPH